MKTDKTDEVEWGKNTVRLARACGCECTTFAVIGLLVFWGPPFLRHGGGMIGEQGAAPSWWSMVPNPSYLSCSGVLAIRNSKVCGVARDLRLVALELRAWLTLAPPHRPLLTYSVTLAHGRA